MTWGRGSTRRWRTLRAQIIARDPICQLRFQGCAGVSTQADHILNVEAHPELEWEPSNLQGVCKPCHELKTQAEAARGRKRAQSPRRPTETHPGALN